MSNSGIIGLVKRNVLTSVCGALALCSGVGTYLIGGQLSEGEVALTQKAAEGARLAANVSYASQLTEQLEALTSTKEKIQKRFVSAGQLATNLQYFYRLEAASGVELIDLRQSTSGEPAKVKTKETSAGVGFAVTVKGDYDAILGWLRQLENGPHFCRVLSGGLTAGSPDRTGPLTLSLSLELLGQP